MAELFDETLAFRFGLILISLLEGAIVQHQIPKIPGNKKKLSFILMLFLEIYYVIIV